jgi:hypothetical protein
LHLYFEHDCDATGICVAPAGAQGTTSCIHCGKELVQGKDGNWYTWDASFSGSARPQAKE